MASIVTKQTDTGGGGGNKIIRKDELTSFMRPTASASTTKPATSATPSGGAFFDDAVKAASQNSTKNNVWQLPTFNEKTGALTPSDTTKAMQSTYTPPVTGGTTASAGYTPYAGSTGAGATSSGNNAQTDWVEGTDTTNGGASTTTPQGDTQQMQAETITSIGSTMDSVSQLMNEVRTMGDDALAVAAAQMDKMTQMLDGIEQQIRANFESQMNGDDPAMQNAIRLIREEADRMKQATLEELNARGLVQSGVYAKALSDLNNNTLNQVQTAVSTRFGDLQTQLNSAIMSLAQTRISALSANQNAVLGVMQNNQNMLAQTGMAGINAQLTARGQDLNNQQFQDTLSFNKEQAVAENKRFYDQLSQEDRQFYDQLSSTEKMQLASIAASKGSGAAGQSLAEKKFEWEKQVYGQEKTDTMNAQNKADTNTQVGLAMQSGGMAEQIIGKVASGSMTVNGARSFLTSSGYTPDAVNAIMSVVSSDPKVVKATAAKTGGSNTNNKSSGYTPYPVTPGGSMFFGI